VINKFIAFVHWRIKQTGQGAREKTPKNGKDENVFDIQQGVSILLLVKL